jgi:hypothetical protein
MFIAISNNNFDKLRRSGMCMSPLTGLAAIRTSGYKHRAPPGLNSLNRLLPSAYCLL